MTTLHIIGNGFDIAHHIKSSYKDFRDYAWANAGEDSYHLGMMETCYPDINPETGELELWRDLEHALGNPDIQAAYDACTEDIEIEEDHEIRYQPQMEDAPTFELSAMYDGFHRVFDKWVNHIDINVEPLQNIPHFDKKGKFLSFNYTETLELLYGVPREQINYIHGRRNTADELIVGHCNDVDGNKALPDDPMIYMYEGFDNVAREVNNQQKKVSTIIARNRNYWRSLSSVNKVVVYGHSLSDIDMPYLSEVVQNVRADAEWHFSIFYQNTIEKKSRVEELKKVIAELGLDINNCHTFHIQKEKDFWI